MIPELGHFALILAALVAAAQCHPLIRRRTAALIQCALCAAALAALGWGFAVSDFTMTAVAEHSHSLLSPAAKTAGFLFSPQGLALAACLALSAASSAAKKSRLPLPLLGLAVIATSLVLNPFSRMDPPPFDGLAVPALTTQDKTS